MVLTEENPIYGPFFGVMGAASAIIFSGKFCQRHLQVATKDIDLSTQMTISMNYSRKPNHSINSMLIYTFISRFIQKYQYNLRILQIYGRSVDRTINPYILTITADSSFKISFILIFLSVSHGFLIDLFDIFCILRENF